MLLLMMNDYKTVWNLNEQGADISAYFRGSFLKKKKNLASISISESWVLKSHHLYVSVHGEFLSAFVWLHVGKLCIR